MPILRTPQSSAALTILYLVTLALQRMSTALPRVWAEFPLLPFDLSQEDERQAQFSINGMPAFSRTSSNRERNAPSISLSEQDGTHFLNSLSEKYLLIFHRIFESAYLYFLCYSSKLTKLPYKLKINISFDFYADFIAIIKYISITTKLSRCLNRHLINLYSWIC